MADIKTDAQKTGATEGSGALHLEDQFHIWFEKNRTTVILTCAVVIIAAAVFSIWYWKSTSTETASSAALAKAKTIPEWEQVVNAYPDSKVAPRALILAADAYFSEGKYKEAQSAYEKFLQQYPNDELTDSAKFGLAACLEAQAKTKEDYAKAGSEYESLMNNFKETFHAGEAQIAMARCAEAQGDLQKTKQLLENVVASMAGSQWAQEARTRLAILNRKMAPSAPQQPNIPSLVLPGSPQPAAPTPPPAPTPAPK